ncbi:MAG: hypothetical protein Q9163_006538 [Psora crenata]
MPRMPEDVRAASTTVLENIYKDAGLAVTPTGVGGNAAVVRPLQQQQQQQHLQDALFVPPAENPFSAYHQQLTVPSRQQQRDDVFSLSTTQYNAITTDDALFSTSSGPTSPKPKRNLQVALAALRNKNKKGSTADAYTRSLMWDEVPTNVVKDFARMVAESNREPLS